jgi:hypothetical protein
MNLSGILECEFLSKKERTVPNPSRVVQLQLIFLRDDIPRMPLCADGVYGGNGKR